jgi:hypothetical protein
MAAPKWITPAGFLGTVTEKVTTSTAIVAEIVEVESISLSHQGKEYSQGLTAVIEGHQYTSGSNASVYPVVSTGSVISIIITDKGSGYLKAPTVTLVKPPSVVTTGTADIGSDTILLSDPFLKIYEGMRVIGTGLSTGTRVLSYAFQDFLLTLNTSTIAPIDGTSDITFSDLGYGAVIGNVSITNNVTYKIINGKLPGGLVINDDGIIYGTPYSVGEIIRSQFTVRASNRDGVTDRTFYIDTQGPTDPVWLTPNGVLPLGVNNQYYTINKQFVDYQLSAEYDQLPPGQKLRYYINEKDGILPPGLSLTEDGRIVGQINDRLKMSYKGTSDGGYDKETYDGFPFDHVTIIDNAVASSARAIAKFYDFIVSVTDGISTSKRQFTVKVEDPSSLRADNTYIHGDTKEYTTDASFLLSPQWLTPANLGIVRANNKQVIKLNSYDFNNFIGPTRYDWTTPKFNQDGSISKHPPNFYLDTNSGALYATLPYQPAYSLSYTFTVWVIKTDNQTGEETATARTFTLTVKGDAESTIEFVTPTRVGSIATGYQSELKVEANHLTSGYSIEYYLIKGRLPVGLSLLKDGTIAGRVVYDSIITFDRASYGYHIFKLDGGNTTLDNKLNFTVQATDVYRQSSVEKEFYIENTEYNLTKYTKIYAEPMISIDQRTLYSTFITDPYTFDSKLLYRPQDRSFGRQEKIRLYIEHGIQQIRISNYYDILYTYFYKKRFLFGSVKYNKATDVNGNYIYDIVYVELIDTLTNKNKQSIRGPVTVGNIISYPNSVANMRIALESGKNDGEEITVDEHLMPRFMQTVQSDTGSPLGFVIVAPLCYALPGNGDTIIKRIKASKFDFTQINFEVDRLVVEDSLDSEGAKYLMFPRVDMLGTNNVTTVSVIDDLLSENQVPITVE